MINFELRKLMECAKEEKLSCIPLIDKIAEVSAEAKRDGLPRLEELIPGLDDHLMRYGITKVTEGCDPALIDRLMEIYIIASYKTGVDLLRQMIIRDGVMGIAEGIETEVLRENLMVWLGEDILLELAKESK